MVTVWAAGNYPYVCYSWTLYAKVKSKFLQPPLPLAPLLSCCSVASRRKLRPWKTRFMMECAVFTCELGDLAAGCSVRSSSCAERSHVSPCRLTCCLCVTVLSPSKKGRNGPLCSLFNCPGNHHPSEKREKKKPFIFSVVTVCSVPHMRA